MVNEGIICGVAARDARPETLSILPGGWTANRFRCLLFGIAICMASDLTTSQFSVIMDVIVLRDGINMMRYLCVTRAGAWAFCLRKAVLWPFGFFHWLLEDGQMALRVRWAVCWSGCVFSSCCSVSRCGVSQRVVMVIFSGE